MKKFYLIVIDMQNDFVYGKFGAPEAQTIVPVIQSKIDSEDPKKIIYLEDEHEDTYSYTEESRIYESHCEPNSRGRESVFKNRKENILVKDTFGYDYFFESTNIMNGDTIEICGVCTDICVISNALILRSLYPCSRIIVDAKACAGTTPEKHRAALEVMKSCAIDVIE